jgi:hypothetical protein
LPDGREQKKKNKNSEYFAYGPSFIPAPSQTTSIDVDCYRLQRTDTSRQRNVTHIEGGHKGFCLRVTRLKLFFWGILFGILGNSEIHPMYYKFAAFIETFCQNLIITRNFQDASNFTFLMCNIFFNSEFLISLHVKIFLRYVKKREVKIRSNSSGFRKRAKNNAANSYERGNKHIDLHEVRRNLYLSRQPATNSFPKRTLLHDVNQL